MSKWQYKEIATGDNRRQNGMTLEHRHVAIQIIGRPPTRTEVVHHIDNDRANNKPENLMVFATQGDHAKYHKGGIAKARTDLIYECKYERKYERKLNGLTRPCLHCGKETVNKKFCSYSCTHIYRRKVVRPTQEVLASMMQSHSWVALGREYGVSDNAVRKWARSYGLL